MKVLHITNAYPYNSYSSFGIFIKEQITSLEKIGVKNEVVFINARKNGWKEYIRSKERIINAIKAFEPEIIHCHHEFSLLPLLFINTETPIILSLLGDIEKRSTKNKILFKVLSRKVKLIIIKNKINPNPWFRYLPNGVDLDLFKPIEKYEAKQRLGLDSELNYILFVTASVQNPIKRYDKYKAVIEKLNMGERGYKELVMTGVSREDVPLYFSASDLLLLTSDHEGSPNAVKEAMACNLPVVSTNVGNVQDLFGNSKGNLLSVSSSVDDLVKLSSQALMATKSEGRKRLLELGLDMGSVAERLGYLYEELQSAVAVTKSKNKD